MKAVVTGGSGFIGSHLVDQLLWSDWQVIVVDPVYGGRGVDVERRIHEVPHLVTGGITPDAIFHLASPVGPVGVLGEAGNIVPAVARDADIVRKWALRANCPLIYVSTSEVYGSGRTDWEGDPCTFQAATSARKEYAVAKLAAETMLRNTEGLDVRIVRPFNVAGPGQKAGGGFVLPRFIAQALAGEPLTVYQPGTQRRAFTHVRDIVNGLMLVLEKGRPGEIYNLGNPKNICTMRQLAEGVIQATKSSSKIELVDPVTLHGPDFREAAEKIPDATKANVELRWEPTRLLDEILSDALRAVQLAAA